MVEREVKFTSPCSSSSSSSPIPVSVGAGDEAYMFSSSSPPFSPASSPPSPEATSILLDDKDFKKLRSAFSLDWSSNLQESESPTSPSSCLRDLLEWLLIRCRKCCCYGGFDFIIKETKQRQEKPLNGS